MKATARRFAVPSPRLLRLSGAVAALALLAPIVPLAGPLWQAAALLLALLVLVDALARPRRGALDVQREIAPLYHAGRAGSYRIRLRNGSGTTLFVALRDVLPPEIAGEGARLRLALRPGEEAHHTVAFTALARGEHALPPLGVGVAHGLRLLEYRAPAGDGDRIAVAPGRPSGEVSRLLARAARLEAAGQQPTRRPQADQEFESLRDYVVGDERRRIDWKASARRHVPIVRQLRQERDAEVVLALDCGRLMGTLIGGVRKLDLAMTPLLDLAAVALRHRDRVGLLAFDARIRAWLPPRPGLAQLHAMTEALARLPDSDEPTSHLRAVAHLERRQRRRALLVVFTDFTDELSAREMYASLGALGRRHRLVFVAISDPHLEAVFEATATDERTLFERATAARLLVERRRTVERIERLGVRTLEGDPRRLSGPLIARYVELALLGAVG